MGELSSWTLPILGEYIEKDFAEDA